MSLTLEIVFYVLVPIAGIFLFLVALSLVGKHRWNLRTQARLAQLNQHATNYEEAHRNLPVVVDSKSPEHTNLPPPVKRFFDNVLRLEDKQRMPIIQRVKLTQDATFLLGGQLRECPATMWVTAEPPGFLWDARIRMFPGFSVHIHDAYIAGQGILHASIGGLVTVAKPHSCLSLDEGELLRFLAEAPMYYPTALLPSDKVSWEAVGENSARVALEDGDCHRVEMLYHFSKVTGFVERVIAKRPREVNGSFVPTEWEGKVEEMQQQEDMFIARRGEVAWYLPDERLAYCQVKTKEIQFEYRTAPLE